MKIICFGDSNTYGYDPQGYFGGHYDADCRWVDILATETGWDIYNMGQNGREIPSAVPAFSDDTDLLIVMLGTNDLLQGRSPEQAAERLERFLVGISLDRSKILLIAPPPMAMGEWVPTLPHLRTTLPGPGGATGHPLYRCWEVGYPPGLRRRTLYGAGPQGLCRWTFGGTQMKRIIPFLLALFLLTGCGGTAAGGSYQQITQEEAKEMMDTQEVIILDVREQDEYDSGHIPGAVLLPVGTIDETTAAAVIPEKDSTVLVYCRSGNRSKTASSTLAELGYTGIYEFGGINTWPYETES